MVSHLFFYQLVLIALVWLCVILHWVWPSDPTIACPTIPLPPPSSPKRRREPTPFVGFTHKPHCDACEHATAPRPQAPSAPPTALLTHYGHWVQSPRRQAQGPAPKPRWMPLPQLLYAQVVKTVRRRRLVRVSHRVVFGTLEAINAVLAPHGWHINTAFVEVRPVGRKEALASGQIARCL
jgi:hypothetical protein